MAVASSPSWNETARQAEAPPDVRPEGTRMVLSLYGEQDMSTAPTVAEALAAATAVGNGDVVVDLRDVQFMDAAIITVLARGNTALRSKGRALMLRAPSKFAQRLLGACGLIGDHGRSPLSEIRQRVE